jgi:hypothetical protein
MRLFSDRNRSANGCLSQAQKMKKRAMREFCADPAGFIDEVLAG